MRQGNIPLKHLVVNNECLSLKASMKPYYMFVLAFLFSTGGASAYNAVFDLKVGNHSVGKATLTGWSDKTLIQFHVTPVPIYTVRYSVLAYLADDGSAYREDIVNNRNSRSNAYTILIRGGEAIRTNVIPPSKEFQREIENPWSPRKPVSIFIVIDRFIRNRAPFTFQNVMLMRELIDEVKTIEVSPGVHRLMDVDEKFVFEIASTKKEGHQVPSRISIIKYRLYGINWSILNLQLVEFSAAGSNLPSGIRN
jgi:hypothetical protein